MNNSLAPRAILVLGVIAVAGLHLSALLQEEHSLSAIRWSKYFWFAAPYLVALAGPLIAPPSTYMKAVTGLMILSVAACAMDWSNAAGHYSRGSQGFSIIGATLFSWLFGLLLLPSLVMAAALRLDINLAGPLDTPAGAPGPAARSDDRNGRAGGSS